MLSDEELVGMMRRANDAADGMFKRFYSEFPDPESEQVMALADDVLALVAEVKELRSGAEDRAIDAAERDYGRDE